MILDDDIAVKINEIEPLDPSIISSLDGVFTQRGPYAIPSVTDFYVALLPFRVIAYFLARTLVMVSL